MTSRSRPTRRAAAVAAVALATLAAGACARRPVRSPLLHPDPRADSIAAPDTFDVRFETSRGPFTVRFHRDWAPRGVDRVHYLVRSGFYDGVRFFRVVPRFVVQFGLSGDTAVARTWARRRIADDSVRQTNARGTVTFAAGGPNTRTTQLFVSLRDNARLDALGFAPLGRVIEGMEAVVDSLHAGYGEGPPRGGGPSQGRIAAEGTAYLAREFPRLDTVRTARVVGAGGIR